MLREREILRWLFHASNHISHLLIPPTIIQGTDAWFGGKKLGKSHQSTQQLVLFRSSLDGRTPRQVDAVQSTQREPERQHSSDSLDEDRWTKIDPASATLTVSIGVALEMLL
ncbi:hypothetical protein PSHT_03397 [Puccinia striiformis]|uniref:Uncharacterized protein n=1 Tax=Puccinia striiformis TaxID=27350 RepID=A0A2S4WFH5_9BASI|nr:hypothetical protein PSHT_03397 [Puccinia striiformis]